MSRLYVAEIRSGGEIPDFGAALLTHIHEKTDPHARAASTAAWRLLRLALDEAGISAPVDIAFAENGKPYLPGGPHFSLSHSHALAAVLISDAPCGVDIEMIDARTAQKLAPRCLSAGEKDLDFFECWTKKECIVKRDGRALFAQPKQLDTTAPEYAGRFFTRYLSDAAGRAYALSALCEDARHIKVRLPDK